MPLSCSLSQKNCFHLFITEYAIRCRLAYHIQPTYFESCSLSTYLHEGFYHICIFNIVQAFSATFDMSIWFFFFFFPSLVQLYLKYSKFTMLYQFQMLSKVIFFFRFFPIIGYYKILSIVPCAIYRSLLFTYFIHFIVFMLISISSFISLCPHYPFW